MRERVVLLSRRMSNFHDPIITMHHSGIFAQKMTKQEEKKSRYDVIMLIAFNELLNNRWIKLQIPLKINANFNDDGDSFRNHRKISNRAYFQIRVYRENRRENFAMCQSLWCCISKIFRSNIYKSRESIGWRVKSIVHVYLYILYIYVYIYTYGARLQRATEDDNA